MALTNEDIINAVSEMSVMQIVELIKAMEEKFGVTAAAAVAAGPAVAAAAAEEQTEFTVVLAGIAADKLVIRRFRRSPAMMALVATVALGTVIRELIRAFYPQGSNPKAFPAIVDGALSLGGLRLSLQPVLIIVISGAIVALIYVLMQRTPIGTRIRAVAEDRDTARLMGIFPERIFAFSASVQPDSVMKATFDPAAFSRRARYINPARNWIGGLAPPLSLVPIMMNVRSGRCESTSRSRRSTSP